MTYILVTGAAGFIASNLLVYLVNKYPQKKFLGIDKESYCSNTRNFLEIQGRDNFLYRKLDLLDESGVRQLFADYAISTVLHLGAYSHVDLSFGNSLLFTQNNVVATHILLEESKRSSVELFLYFSTDEVYGSRDEISHETSTRDPSNPYSNSKACGEFLARSYYHSFKMPVIVTRCNNVYGPKQFLEKVIPKFIFRLFYDQSLQIQGSGEQKRSFLYVDDVSKAVDILLDKGIPGEIYNIGTTNEITINTLAEKLTFLLGKERNIQHITDRNFNDQRYLISSEKIQQLGWAIETDFQEGLTKTIEWYRLNKDFYSDEILHDYVGIDS